MDAPHKELQLFNITDDQQSLANAVNADHLEAEHVHKVCTHIQCMLVGYSLCFRLSQIVMLHFCVSASARLVDGDDMFSCCLLVSSFVCYQSCEHDVLKTNKLVLMQIGTSGQRHDTINFGVRRSKFKVTQG